MPTKKPIIQTVVEEDIYEKFKEICQKEDRKASDMARIIIKKYIKDYENENGRVKTNTELSISKIG